MTDPRLTVELDDESVEWLIEAARHHSPGGMGHVADELTSALHYRRQGVPSDPPPPAPPTDPSLPFRIKPMSESAHALLDGILADVWNQGYAEGQRYNEGMAPEASEINPYRQATKPEPTREEIIRHLILLHNAQGPVDQLDRDTMIEAHDQDHKLGTVRHDREDWAS